MKTYRVTSYLPALSITVPIFHDRTPITDQMQKAMKLLAITLEDEKNAEQLLNNLLSMVILIRLQADNYIRDFEDLISGEKIPRGLLRVIKKKLSENSIFREKDLMNVVLKLFKKGESSFEVLGSGKCFEVEIITKKIIVIPNVRKGCLKKVGAGLQDKMEDTFLGNTANTVDLEIEGKKFSILQLPVGKVVDKQRHIVVLENDSLMYTGRDMISTVNCTDQRGEHRVNIRTGTQINLRY